MCIVIDSCTISIVFNPNSAEHKEFLPVLEWVTTGCGKMIYGGRKYKDELSKLGKYIGIISQLKRAGKIIEVSESQVNDVEKQVSKLVSDKDFDDPHIVAIVIVSGCKVVCTTDTRSIKYLKNSVFYRAPIKKPKIYTGLRNKKLLTSKYYSDICKPEIKGPKVLQDLAQSLITTI
jgi:hypothetical protein